VYPNGTRRIRLFLADHRWDVVDGDVCADPVDHRIVRLRRCRVRRVPWVFVLASRVFTEIKASGIL
jgi:hypothetical protein